jgi:Holliday junction resolvase-like predicted endonuclease
MPLFDYSAIEQNSRKSIAGQIEALDLRHAKEQIRNLGHIPTEINEHREDMTIAGLLSTVPVLGDLNNPGSKDLFIFTEQIHTLLDAGVPLIDGLFLLENQTTHQGMAEIIKDIRTHVITGDSFSNALAFIEVKTRRGNTAIEMAMAAITPKKQQQMAAISEMFIAENPCYQGHNCQFDIVAINWPTGREIEPNQIELVHLPNAFSS